MLVTQSWPPPHRPTNNRISFHAMELSANQGGHTGQITSKLYHPHPVTQCPHDILRCIFAAQMESADSKHMFKAATTLSSVCQEWRYISLNMPQLWNNVMISCLQPIEDTLAFLECVHSRVKAVPVNIVIDEIDYYEEEGEEEKGCDLSRLRLIRFPHIRSLRLQMYNDNSLRKTFFSRGPHALRDRQIDKIEIEYLHNRYIPVSPYDLSDLVGSLPTLKAVSFILMRNMHITPHEDLDQIRVASFDNMGIDLLVTLQCFSHIEELILNWVTPTDDLQLLSVPLVMKQLRILRLRQFSGFDAHSLGQCLRQLSCPALALLQIADPYLIDDCMEFISSHSSIVELDGCPSGRIHELIDTSPQLHSLTICVDDEESGEIWEMGDKLPFPRLKQLCIYLNESDTFTVNHFEKLVRARCLPMTHPLSQLLPSSESIQQLIIVPHVLNEYHTWMASELFKEATKTAVGGEPGAEVRLSWISRDITKLSVVKLAFE